MGRVAGTVLVAGAGGQLGREVADAFEGWDVVACDRARLDIADREAVLAAVTAVRPDVIVNAGAATDVDRCEREPDWAYAVNALGVRHLAEGARRVAAYLLHVSTDYVFDGEKAAPYHEWDATNPLSQYGRSKLAGEAEVGPDGAVVRTSWVFGRHGRNFVTTVLGRAAEPGPLRFIDDQVGVPTAADDLAGTIRRLAAERRSGLFHVTNAGPTSRFEQARAVLAAAGMDPARVEPMRSSELTWLAARPAMTVLDNAVLRIEGIPLLPDHRESMERIVKELVA